MLAQLNTICGLRHPWGGAQIVPHADNYLLMQLCINTATCPSYYSPRGLVGGHLVVLA